MALYLSPECLQYILTYLEDDNHTLHSCLLVNRFWCHNTVKILWSQPWRSYDITQASATSATKLIQTYVNCLSDKVVLLKNGINYQVSSTPQAYDYASFLRALDYDGMYWSISQWLDSCWLYRMLNYEEELKSDTESKLSLDDMSSENYCEYFDESEEKERKTNIIAKELCNLFMSRCTTFHSLRLETKAIQSNFPFLPSCNDPCNYLSNLRQLICLAEYKSELLIAISRICKDLRRICAGFPLSVLWKSHYETDAQNLVTRAEAQSLVTLVEAQNRLQSVCLFGYKRFVSVIVDALKRHADSLTSLELMYTDFRDNNDFSSLKTLSLCKSLKSLKIHNCFIPPNEELMPLASFSKLEEFYFCNEWNPLYPLPQHEFWEIMFHNTKNSLRKMSLLWLRSDPKDGCQIIDPIAKQCSNINILHLPVLWINEVLIILNYCTQLKVFSFSGDDFDANESLTQMGKLVPVTLQSLTIKDGHMGGWTFTEKSLDCFLKNCNASLEIMDLTFCSCATDRHYEVLSQHRIITGLV
ncbi:17499_t:CDS:1 [Cetraspora pellucida]|uniref:17499_t:CDS:1 n=1 Tax=Cetraspora pellucida TaxID=1433469 RepID=A0ACA9M377_9GLOM|nr:17499_t:CDS:1 [Cetraspora pellucida]